MTTTLATLAALHVPQRDKAQKLIHALEEITDAAATLLEDWRSGIEDGTYDKSLSANADRLEAALELIEE